MEGIDSNTIKKAAAILRKRGLEFNPSEDDSEFYSILEYEHIQKWNIIGFYWFYWLNFIWKKK